MALRFPLDAMTVSRGSSPHTPLYMNTGARNQFYPASARHPFSRLQGLNIEFEPSFGGKLRWLIRLQTGI